MALGHKYSIRDLKRDFPDDKSCVSFVFDALHSRKCSCGGVYSLMAGRRQFQCGKCRFQIAPCQGTIFEKSSTPLHLWFHAIFIFSNAKSGISSSEMERQLGVTYKCAWRILYQIRKALRQEGKLSGDVETDTGFFGGPVRKKDTASKPVVMAAVERGGRARLRVVRNHGATDTHAFVNENVEKGSRLYTDGALAYKNLKGYRKRKVIHARGFVRGKAHTNSVESLFSHIKRSMRGTFKVVSAQHLQSYLDAFVFHFDNRRSDTERFASLLGTAMCGAR